MKVQSGGGQAFFSQIEYLEYTYHQGVVFAFIDLFFVDLRCSARVWHNHTLFTGGKTPCSWDAGMMGLQYQGGESVGKEDG